MSTKLTKWRVANLSTNHRGIFVVPRVGTQGLPTAIHGVCLPRAPESCASVSSTFGRGCTSLRTFSFSGFKSTQIRIAPSLFGTTTIPAHHGVGSSTFEMTPMDSMRSSSSLTFGRNGRGTCLGANREGGVVPDLRWISYSSPRFPSPLNSEGNCSKLSAGICVAVDELSVSVASSWTASPRADMAGSPKRFVLRPSMTYTRCCTAFPL